MPYEFRVAASSDSERQKALRADGFRPYTEAGGVAYYQRYAAPPDADGPSANGPSALSYAEVTQEHTEALADAGFESADAVRVASDDDLLAVPGIGPKTLARIRESLA